MMNQDLLMNDQVLVQDNSEHAQTQQPFNIKVPPMTAALPPL